MKCLIIALAAFILGCSTKSDSPIIASAESYLKSQMKDPSSFQVIKSEIIDTTMMSEYLNIQYDKDTSSITRIITENKLKVLNQKFEVGEESEKAEYEKLLQKTVDVHKSTAERHLKMINDLKQDSIYYISINIDYRAKNSFGALDKGSKIIRFYPGDKSLKIE